MANELEVIRGLFIQQQKYIQNACDTEKDEGSSLKIFIMHAYIYQTEWMTDEFIFCSHNNNKPKDHSIVQCTTQFIKVRVKCVNIVNCMHFTQYVIQWHLFMIISHLWLCNIPCTIHQLPFMNSQVVWAHIPKNLTRGSHLWKLDELKVWYRKKISIWEYRLIKAYLFQMQIIIRNFTWDALLFSFVLNSPWRLLGKTDSDPPVFSLNSKSDQVQTSYNHFW